MPILRRIPDWCSAELLRFKAAHGTTWKQALWDLWKSGADERHPDRVVLRQLRNSVLRDEILALLDAAQVWKPTAGERKRIRDDGCRGVEGRVQR